MQHSQVRDEAEGYLFIITLSLLPEKDKYELASIYGMAAKWKIKERIELSSDKSREVWGKKNKAHLFCIESTNETSLS